MTETMEERVLELMHEERMNASSFSKHIKVANTTLNQQLYGRTDGSGMGIRMNVAQAILREFPRVSAEWLMRGEEPMYKDEGEKTPKPEGLDELRQEVESLKADMARVKRRIGVR